MFPFYLMCARTLFIMSAIQITRFPSIYTVSIDFVSPPGDVQLTTLLPKPFSAIRLSIYNVAFI